MNYIDFMKGGGIHIKEENRGKFTASAERAGKSVQEHATDVLNDPHATQLLKRRAQFAKNAKKWNHEDGGPIYALSGATVTLNYTKVEDKEYLDESLFPDPDDDPKDSEETEGTEQGNEQSPDESDSNWINEYLQKYSTDSDEGTSESAGSTSTSTSTDVPPASATAKASYKLVMDYLTSKGLSRAGAAGVAGVFMAESGLTAGRVNEDEDAKYGGQKAGKGLGQWSNARRVQYNLFMLGKDTTIENELDFFMLDLETRPLVKKVLLNTDSVEEAVKAMHLGYENGSAGAMATPELLTQQYSASWAKLGYRPYNYEASHNTRFKYAQQAFNA